MNTLSNKATDFIAQTPIGSLIEFSPSRTGEHNKDGSVFYNHDGLTNYLFGSIADFAAYQIDGNRTIEHQASFYIGSRDHDGVITFSGEHYTDDEIDSEEDGSGVYTNYVTVNAMTQ